MKKQLIRLFKKKRFETISLKKSTYHAMNIIVFDKVSENMLAVVEFRDKNKLHLAEFNHLTPEQKDEIQYILTHFEKTYNSL